MNDAPDLTSLPMFHLTQTPIQARFATPQAPPPVAPVIPRHAPSAPPRIDPGVDLDWALVDQMRRDVSSRLTEAIKGEPVDEERSRRLGRDLIHDLLQEHARESMRTGATPLTLPVQTRMNQAIYDALFGLGRLQPLLDRDDIENIEGFGCDNITLEDLNGVRHQGPAVARNDEELVEFLAFVGSRHGNPRPFSEAVPRLHLRLEGGARLAAVAFTTPRPVFVIRRHRLQNVTLSDLVATNTISANLASFLAAAVKANLNIVVAGVQGAGKTTLVRALCAEIPLREKVGTFETEYELHLHEMPGRADRVVAFEARPGSGERGVDGRVAGEVTLTDELYDSFRLNLDRQIVGEVRGDEVLPMIKAMQSGAGSICTTHGRSARHALSKLVTCAMEAGTTVTEAYATRAIAETLDLLIYVHRDDTGSTRSRYVTEVVAVGWNPEGVSYTDVYAPGPDGRAAPHVLRDDLRSLTRDGFDLETFQRQAPK